MVRTEFLIGKEKTGLDDSQSWTGKCIHDGAHGTMGESLAMMGVWSFINGFDGE